MLWMFIPNNFAYDALPLPLLPPALGWRARVQWLQSYESDNPGDRQTFFQEFLDWFAWEITGRQLFGLLPMCFLALWPVLAGKKSNTVDLTENNALNLQFFSYFETFWHFPCMTKLRICFCFKLNWTFCIGEVDHGRRQKPLPGMRTRWRKQEPMFRFMQGTGEVSGGPTLFLFMEWKSGLLCHSWFGEDSNLLERWIVKKMPPPNRARMAGGGEGHRVEHRNSTHRLLYHRVCVCQWEKPPFVISHSPLSI